MEKPNICFMGTPEFSVPVLEGLIENYNVVLVVTQPDKPVGRSKKNQETPIKKLAKMNNIPVITPNKIKEEYQNIIDYKPDIIITCAYGQIIPKELIEYPRLGCINVHASLLPKLRGGAPIHRAVIDGHKETGITIMYMDEKMDNGDIISQRKIPISDIDNTGIIHDKLKKIGKELLLDTMKSIIVGTNERIKQDEKEVTYAYNIKRADELLDFTKTTKELYNQVRGLYPWPLSYLLIDGLEIKVLEAKVHPDNINGKVGEIIDAKNELLIKTIDGILSITKVKPSGKKEMLVKDYTNSRKDLIGKEVNNV